MTFSAAFGRWTFKHIKSRTGAQLMTILLGVLIFIDDYFNCLTVGSVMRPVTDKHNVSRAKLAWVLDSTAAPVCILVPISSWVITVISILKGSEGFESFGITEFSFFLKAVPYNIYAILTLIMVVTIILTGRDYGPMKKSQQLADEGILFNAKYGEAPG